MIPPKDFYKENRTNAKIRRESYKMFFDKYQMNKPDPDGFKLTERELYKPSSKNFFIPGKIYTFRYDPLFKNKLDYFDRNPIILCHDNIKAKGTGNELVVGVNLNLLPEKIKAGTLQIFYENFKQDIEQGEYKANRGQTHISARLIKSLVDWLSTVSVFKNSNIHYDFSYRQYIKPRIQHASLVEYDDWNYIPFIRPQEIMGKSLNEIYNDYYSFSKKK